MGVLSKDSTFRMSPCTAVTTISSPFAMNSEASHLQNSLSMRAHPWRLRSECAIPVFPIRDSFPRRGGLTRIFQISLIIMISLMMRMAITLRYEERGGYKSKIGRITKKNVVNTISSIRMIKRAAMRFQNM